MNGEALREHGFSEHSEFSGHSESSNSPASSAGLSSFWDHLEALRWTLVRIVAAVAVVAVADFAFIPWLFDHVVMAPSREDFFLYRALASMGQWASWLTGGDVAQPFHVSLINIKLPSQFFMHMSLSLWAAVLVAFPYMLFELWRFVRPALYESERRRVRLAAVFGTAMFYLGCAVGYAVVFPMTLRFLASYQLSPDIENQLLLDSYMDNFMMLTFMMGVVFELPLVAMLLSRMRLIHRSFFSRYRRHAIVALLVVAAVITPSSDPFTLMAVFIPVYALWELSALLVAK